MRWMEMIIKTTGEACDIVSEMLISLGAGGVAIDDPEEFRRLAGTPGTSDYVDDRHPDLQGNSVTVKAYFNGEQDGEKLISLVREKLGDIALNLDIGEGLAGYSHIDEEDWSEAWKKYYTTFHITGHVVVKPSWEEYAPGRGETVVVIDPGMAFGTGTHETTAMCAGFIEKYMKKGDRVLDIGCGTGILSIIAAKLGAAGVKAVDTDAIAVKVAKDNCRTNAVDDRVEVVKGVLDDLAREKADLIVANIIADVIMDIAPSIPSYLKNGGFFITSGIIRERKKEVTDVCTGLGFALEEEKEQGEWVAMVFRCQGSL